MSDADDIQYRPLGGDDRLTETQYRAVSELIFDTDPYIYPALFGEGEAGRENAARLLPVVFESGMDAMFRKESLYLSLLGEEIVGLILWHKGSMDWDTSVLLELARREKIALSQEDAELVGREYVAERYLNQQENCAERVSVVNVCVKKEHRGRGIAGNMLRSFLSEHAGEPMELTVLADNASAISVYERAGFRVAYESPGFSKYADKPQCLTMVRDTL